MASTEKYSVFAAAQPSLPLPFQTGDVVLVVRAGVPYKLPPAALRQITYDRVQPVTGNTISATAGLGAFVIDPAGLLATLAMVLPPTPGDGDVFEASTTQDITALTVTAPGITTVAGGGPFTLAANGGASWRYDLSLDKWFPRY